jgi:hypothetical protein
MGFIRALAEFAAAAANLHPDHRPRYDELVTHPERPRPRAESPAGGADTPEADAASRRVG